MIQIISHCYWSIRRYSTVLKVMTDETFLMNCQKDHKPLYCFYFCHQKLACLPFFFLLLVPFEYSSSESCIKKDYAKNLLNLLAWHDSKPFEEDRYLYFSFRGSNKNKIKFNTCFEVFNPFR